MDLTKPLFIGEVEMPIWKHKFGHLLGYYESALDDIDGKLVKPHFYITLPNMLKLRNIKYILIPIKSHRRVKPMTT